MSEQKPFEPTVNPMTATVQEMFGQVMSQRIQSGAVEAAITKYVDKLIDDAASEVFRSYGDVGKALKEQFANAIMPRLESIDDLPTYHEYVTNRLKLATQQFYDSRLAAVLDKELQELLTELPEQITLSWLVKQIIKERRGDNDEYEGQITLIIRPTFSWTNTSMSVFLDKEQDQDESNCDYDMHLSLDKESGKWEMLGLRVNGKNAGEQLSIGRLYNLNKILFNIYAMKGKIDLDCGTDAYDYHTSWCND